MNHDDEDDDGGHEDGDLTTPLSPPPQTHQTKAAGLGGLAAPKRDSIASSRYPPTPVLPEDRVAGDADGRGGLGRKGTIKILFSPNMSSTTATATATTIVNPGQPVVMPIAGASSTRSLTDKYNPTPAVDPKSADPPAKPKGASRFREVRESMWPRPHGLEQPPPQPPYPTNDNELEISPILSPFLPPPIPNDKPSKIKRKTIFERIEGWWDLGLLRGGTIRGRAAPFSSGTADRTRRVDATTAGHTTVAFI